MSMPLSTQLSIGIASKNRPAVLEATLRKIHAFGLGDCPLILFDDGSTPPLNPPAIGLFKNARVLRSEPSVGQALGRNQICEQAATPFLLQLDDDSYPVEGDVDKLIDFATTTPDWLAIAIPFEEPARGRKWPAGIPKDKAIPIRSFVGCSVLLNIKQFRSIGGYATWIGRTAEEEELSLRSWKAGMPTLSIDLLRIRHEVTDMGRDVNGIAYRSFRNWLLLWLCHAPLRTIPNRLLRLLGASLGHFLSRGEISSIRGFFAGIKMAPNIVRQYRDPLSTQQYIRYRSLPHALDLFLK